MQLSCCASERTSVPILGLPVRVLSLLKKPVRLVGVDPDEMISHFDVAHTIWRFKWSFLVLQFGNVAINAILCDRIAQLRRLSTFLSFVTGLAPLRK